MQYVGHIQGTIWDFNAGLGLSNFILDEKRKIKKTIKNKLKVKQQRIYCNNTRHFIFRHIDNHRQKKSI